MTITARQTATRIHAIRLLVGKLDALPLAVSEIHRAIDEGTINERDRPHVEDAGVRSINAISDPTGQAAVAHVGAVDRHLGDVEAELARLALAAGNLADVVSRWVRSAELEHRRCGDHTSRDIKLEEWYTTPNSRGRVPASCDNPAWGDELGEGKTSWRSHGLCTACYQARRRWLSDRDEVA